MFFVHFGIDPEEFLPIETKIGDYILSAGDGARDYETLIEASKQIDSKIRIVSKRYKFDSVFLPENVGYINYVPISKLKEMIAAAKFIVLPLQNVPSSCGQSVLLQSMAMKKAVITSKVPGVIDYVIDGKTSLLYNPYDAKDLREKINYLLKHPDEIRRIGENARAAVLSNFTEDKMSKKIYEVLRKVTTK